MKAMIIAAAFATVFLCTPALASQNLVINGGFETGNFSGWSQSGDTKYTSVYGQGKAIGSGPVYPVADGQFSAAFGPSTGLGSITQTIDTVPGRSYNVSFVLANTDIEAHNQFIFSFDDGFQITSASLSPFGFRTISLPVTASGLTADVSFLFFNPTAFFLLDDVSVTPAVPEPATWSLLLAGFAIIGTTMRRHKPLTA